MVSKHLSEGTEQPSLQGGLAHVVKPWRLTRLEGANYCQATCGSSGVAFPNGQDGPRHKHTRAPDPIQEEQKRLSQRMSTSQDPEV